MAEPNPTYKLRKLSKDATFTITVKETNEFKIRRKIALALFYLGAWVIGFRVEIVDMPNDYQRADAHK